jgi:hypothetical protein
MQNDKEQCRTLQDNEGQGRTMYIGQIQDIEGHYIKVRAGQCDTVHGFELRTNKIM